MCPISLSTWSTRMTSLLFMYRAPISDSASEDRTVLIICAIVRMAPLGGSLRLDTYPNPA